MGYEYVHIPPVPENYNPKYKNFMVFVSMDYQKSGVKLREGDTDYSKIEKTFNLLIN